jgi:hypothetical protein
MDELLRGGQGDGKDRPLFQTEKGERPSGRRRTSSSGLVRELPPRQTAKPAREHLCVLLVPNERFITFNPEIRVVVLVSGWIPRF